VNAIAAGSALVCVALGYASGSLPWALWLGRWIKGVDVRTVGSGNLGATNVYRNLGPPLGIAVLLLDIAKGALPTWIVPALPFAAAFPGGAEWCRVAVGLAAILGHMFTFLASFRGGKGVATTAGVLLALAPLAFAVFVVAFFVTLAPTRIVSVSSIVGSIAFVIALAMVAPGGVASPTFIAGALVALLIIVRHRGNIVRLLQGREGRFAFRGASDRAPDAGAPRPGDGGAPPQRRGGA
jgi:glycerol-3-phosphate acyltransferase PlsY